jgi:hypothetical protein
VEILDGIMPTEKSLDYLVFIVGIKNLAISNGMHGVIGTGYPFQVLTTLRFVEHVPIISGGFPLLSGSS